MTPTGGVGLRYHCSLTGRPRVEWPGNTRAMHGTMHGPNTDHTLY